MVSAELATGWPEQGGVFVWVKEAFGHRTGFLAIWLLWAENLVYYPALISFIAGTIAYLFCPSLVQNTWYMLSFVLLLFWTTTLLNLRGMRTSGWISTLGVIAGTLLPGGLIILLGLYWFCSGQPVHLSFQWREWLPTHFSPSYLVLFSGVLVSLCGLEMSAVHAGDVARPQKNYPRAILLAALLTLGLYLFGVLAIAAVVPREEICLVSGSLQAFATFVHAYHLPGLMPLIALLLALGAFGTLSTWIVGPSTGLLAAAQQGDLPPFFRRCNRHGVPTRLLFTQAIIVTLFSSVFLFMPTVSSAYWILNATLAQLYLLMYLLLFAAAIKLRYKYPQVVRHYRVPGGNCGMWIIAGAGFLGSLATFCVGFFPPAQIATGHTGRYVAFLVGSLLLALLTPSLLLRFKKPEWDYIYN